MSNERLTVFSFVVSLTAHIFVLSAVDGFFDVSFLEKKSIPQTTHVHMKKDKRALLPDIKVLGQMKQLQSKKSNQKPEARNQKPETRSQGLEISLKNEMQLKKSKEKVKIVDSDQEAMLRYQDMVKQSIESCRRYPMGAMRREVEGTVDLKFVILNNGESKDIKIIHSSGYKILDKEALDTIRRANPFLPLPEQIPHDVVTIYVSIVFSLD